MNAIPDWLRRCATRWLKEGSARGRRPIGKSSLEELEHRNLPGSGMDVTGVLSDPMPGDETRARPADRTSMNGAAARARSAAPTRHLRQATIGTRRSATDRMAAAKASKSHPPQPAPMPLVATPGVPPILSPPPSRPPGWNRSSATSPPTTQPGGPTGSPTPTTSPSSPVPTRSNPPPPSSAFRPIDEVGNNRANASLGTAGTDLLRVSPAAYADGISAPSLASNPSARVISDLLNNQADPADPSQDLNTVDAQSLSDFGYAFGQFIDHDLDLTPTDPSQALQILADPNDPSEMGNQTFDRSVFDPSTGTSTSNPRQQVNAVTSYLDLSNVYGSTQEVADALRTFSGGQLKTSPGNMLPYDNLTYFTQAQIDALDMANDAQAVPESSLFAAGDIRANENVELTALADAVPAQPQPHRRRAPDGASRLERRAASTRRLGRSTSPSTRRSSIRSTCRTSSARRSPGLRRLQSRRQPGDRDRVLDRGLPVRPQPAEPRDRAPGQRRTGPAARRPRRRGHQPGHRLLRPLRAQPHRGGGSANRPHLDRHRSYPQGRRRRRLAGRRPAGDRRHPQPPLRQRRAAGQRAGPDRPRRREGPGRRHRHV